MKSWAFKGMLAAAIVLPALGSVARADDFGCSNATLKGEYAFGVTDFTLPQVVAGIKVSTGMAISPSAITSAIAFPPGSHRLGKKPALT